MLCFPHPPAILPSGAGVISVIRRCGLGTGAGHTSFPRAGTSGRLNTISYRCCVFRKPTYNKGEGDMLIRLKGKESSEDLAIWRIYNGFFLSPINFGLIRLYHRERGVGWKENSGERGIYTEGKQALAWPQVTYYKSTTAQQIKD